MDAILDAHILMLMVVVLAIFRKADTREALLIERVVISTTQITIKAELQERLHSRVVGPSDFRNVAGELAGDGIALAA